MAKIEVGSVKVELSQAELEVVKRALSLVQNYGEFEDDAPSRSLLEVLREAPAL